MLGDSLPAVPPRGCSGCASFLTQYSDHLTDSLERPVEFHADAVDDSRLADVSTRLQQPTVIDDLAGADVVLVWVGFNEGPPYSADTPCATAPGDTAASQVAAVESYDDTCLAATIGFYRQRYDELFAEIARRSPQASLRLALNTYDNWGENPAFADLALPAARSVPLLAKVTGIFDAWNRTQCEAAEQSGFECVDVYHLMNGPDGSQPLTPFVGADFTHLSQGGHDALAGLLASVALPAA